MAMTAGDSQSRATLGIAALAFFSYFLIARAVHNLYPFSTFDMYATTAQPSSTRLLLRNASGQIFDLDQFGQFACDGALQFQGSIRAGDYVLDYLDRKAERWITEHKAAGAVTGEPVDLIRRVWQLAPGGGISHSEDRLLNHCRASRL